MFVNNEEMAKETRVGAQLRCANAAALFAFAALLFAPQAVLAQDECGAQMGATPVVCDQAEYDDGVTYDADGDLTVNFTSNISEIGENNGVGIVLSGDGAENITFDSATAQSEIESRNTVGPLLDVSTVDGNILIMPEELDADGQNSSGVTHGILATTSGTGSIDIIKGSGTIDVESAGTSASAVAIEADAQGGGDINIVQTSGIIIGQQYGILANATGGGDITVTTGAGGGFGFLRVSDTNGIALIRAVADTGDITLNMGRIVENTLSVESGGTSTINLNAELEISGNREARTAIEIAGTGPAVVNINEDDGDRFGTLRGGINAENNTGGVTVNNAADSGGWSFAEDALVLSDTDDTINNAGVISSNTAPGQSANLPNSFQATTAAFGGGQDVFNNSGALVAGGNSFFFSNFNLFPLTGTYSIQTSTPAAGDVTFEGLETFNNSGLIVLGGQIYEGGTNNLGGGTPEDFGPRFVIGTERADDYCRQLLGRFGLSTPVPGGVPCTASSPRVHDTDLVNNDTLSMPGTLFTGSGASRILLDAVFGRGVPQTNCVDRRPGDEFFLLPGADCVDLSNGGTAGSTQIVVRDGNPGHQGASNPDGIVIVDVSGGTSAAEHFTLSPTSDNYAETGTGRGVIDKGLFVFPLVYDPSAQQHKLVGIPGAGAFQMALLAQGARELSRRATASGIDERQAKLGAALRAGTALEGGFWGSLSHDTAERDVVNSTSASGETFGFNNDFDQDSTTLMLGRDFIIPAADQSAWLWGGSIGYLRANLDFDATPNKGTLEGVALSVHGGYRTGAWFVNAALGQSFLKVDHFAPTYDLSGEDDSVQTDAQTQNLHLEGGYRFALTDALHVEPLATLSWAKTDFDDVEVSSPDNPLATSNAVEFEDSTSLRAGLGARLSLNTQLRGLNLDYALTGRVLSETDGETDVTIKDSNGAAVPISDTFDGTFTEVTASVGLSNADNSMSGFLNIDSSFGDDYDSLGAELGFRYQW